ncbi:hypothetical protein [Marinobacter nauticus]|uniref:Uncharacterized protein n=1 Tax=Marinobacter nauticus TaxID=2743 RepID=A0A833JQB6_MARNT|nr:hypothetical protein [Marinobacter nauticus]KAE8546134.1 hypothetical protein F6453_1380 [Marinobacter nauticus]
MKLLTIALFTVFLAGCSTLDRIEENPMTARLVTNQITLRFIAGSDNPVVRAAEVREAVETLKGRINGDREFTLAEFQGFALDQFDFDSLSLADQALVMEGIRLARRSIADLIGEGVVEPDERYTLVTLLTWIDTAAARVK